MSKKSKWDSSSGSDNDDNDIVNEKKIGNGANKKIKTSIKFENSNSVDDNNNIDRSVIKIDGIDIMNKSSGSKTLDVTSQVNINNNNDLNDMNVISSENIIVFNDGIDQQLKCDSDEVKLQYDLTADKDVIDPVSNNSDENMNAVTTNITTTDASHQSAITINPTSSTSLSTSSSSSSYVASTKRMMITTTSNTTATTKHTYNPLFDGCRSVDCYQRLNFIDQGTYGMVFKAKCRDSHEIYALKQIKFGNEISKMGFPITALREINILLSLNHPNIVKVKEMVIGSSIDKIYMVMEYCENDLKTCMKLAKQSFSTAEIKQLMIQLLSAISYMHERWYIHRDLKTSNLLYSNKGYLAVCDFGLARYLLCLMFMNMMMMQIMIIMMIMIIVMMMSMMMKVMIIIIMMMIMMMMLIIIMTL
jgi:hypothetical protein